MWPPADCRDSSNFKPEEKCHIKPLRWHRIYAAGLRMGWTPDGLDIETSSESKSTTSVDLEGEVERGVVDGVLQPSFLLHNGSRALSDDGSSLRYKILVDKISVSSQGLFDVATEPIGHSGRFGHLGCVSILFQGGSINPLHLAGHSVLELFVGIHFGDLRRRPPAGDVVTNSTARYFDDGDLMVWGSLGDLGDQQGFAPRAIHGFAETTMPLDRINISPEIVVPSHPLSSSSPSSSSSESPGPAPTGPSAGAWEPNEEVLRSYEGWRASVRAGAFGPSSLSLGAALFHPSGMARWSGEVIDLWEDMKQRMSEAKEEVMVVAGGCKRDRRVLLEVFMCL